MAHSMRSATATTTTNADETIGTTHNGDPRKVDHVKRADIKRGRLSDQRDNQNGADWKKNDADDAELDEPI